MRDQAAYDGLDTPALTNLLLNPNQRPEVHRAALSALSRRRPQERTQRLLDVLKAVIDSPKRYDQQVMVATIDILATDPNARATEALIEMLPSVLNAYELRTGLADEFREYFYEALVTRRREDDIEVWRKKLPDLGSDSLVAMLYDPAAKALKSIDPLKLITKLPASQRNAALRKVFFRSLVSNPAFAFQAFQLMLNPNRPLPSNNSKKRS
jgi:hypothetical protein